MILEKYANMKNKYGNRHFRCRGYYVDTVGRNKKAIAEYIRKQQQEDISYDQKTLEENVDPYTGKQVKEGKSKAPLGAASESAAVGKPWSYALRGLCILPARPVVMIAWCLKAME